ncbi:hypothetical protein EON65_11735 [archaeon]|nr:MAG: hypothetical protein EON65_11735 [archaeon]
MAASFTGLHGLRVVTVTWNCNSRIETNVDLIRKQLLGLEIQGEDKVQQPPATYDQYPDLIDDLASAQVSTEKSGDGSSSNSVGRRLVLKKPDVLNTMTSESNDSNVPDLVIVGLQEIIELSTTSVLSSAVIGQNSIDQVDQWQDTLLKALNYTDKDQAEGEYQYRLIARQHMVGLAILVFSTQQLESCISQVQVSTLARGVGGVLGNKGAVYVRMKILDSTMCIVNAHFTAHRENVHRRNEDYFAILTYPAFTNELHLKTRHLDDLIVEPPGVSHLKQDLSRIKKRIHNLLNNTDNYDSTQRGSMINSSGGFALSAYNDEASQDNTKFSAEDHDIILWLGDLNYRIVKSIHINTVFELLEKGSIDLLSDFDQLTIEKDAGNVFQYFNEGLLFFPPTYQYTPFKDEYNRTSKKQRVPSWCDRILWRIGKRKTTKQLTLTEDSQEEEDMASERTGTEKVVSMANPISMRLQKAPSQDKVLLKAESLDEFSQFVNATVAMDSDDEESDDDKEPASLESTMTESDKRESLVEDIRRNSMYIRRNSAMLAEINVTVPEERHLSRGSLLREVGSNAAAPTSPRHASATYSISKLQDALDTSRLSLNQAEEQIDLGPLDYNWMLRKQQEDSIFQERIELMEYNVCEGLFMSDHKPVRAILNMKVKKLDWGAYEKDVSQETFHILSDPFFPLKSHLASQPVVKPMYPNSAYVNSACRIRYLHVSPSVLGLKSVTRDGDRQYLTLTNTHSSYTLHYRICDSDCSRWLKVVEPQDNSGTIGAGERKVLIIGNEHRESTLK